jgi:hypothetical protein
MGKAASIIGQLPYGLCGKREIVSDGWGKTEKQILD